MKKINWIILLCLGCLNLFAEVRVWTNEDGTLLTGSFVRILLGKVQVRDENKKLHLIPVDKLSRQDAYYIENEVVPEIDISCRSGTAMKPIMEWSIADDRTTLYTFDVRLAKKSPLPYRPTLTAELYIIADEIDGKNYILMHREATKFTFPNEKESVFEFTVKDVPHRKYEAGWVDVAPPIRGQAYSGYIVAVLDSKGNLITYKTDLENEIWFRDDIPGGIEKLRALAIEGRGSSFSRHFNDQIQKTSVPRIPWYKRSRFF